MSLTKADSPDPVPTGSVLTYTLTAATAGAGAAAGVVVTNSLPAGVTFMAATASQGACSGGGTVSCGLGTVAASGSATVKIDVLVTADPGGGRISITDSALVTTTSLEGRRPRRLTDVARAGPRRARNRVWRPHLEAANRSRAIAAPALGSAARRSCRF